MAVIPHSNHLYFFFRHIINILNGPLLLCMKCKNPVKPSNLPSNVLPLQICLLHLPQICIMTKAKDLPVWKMFPHNGGQKIKMMAQNQIRIQISYCLIQLFQKTFFECRFHLWCHIPVSGTRIWHLVRHSYNRKVQFPLFKIYRIKCDQIRYRSFLLRIHTGYQCLCVSLICKFLHQLRQKNPTAGAIRFLRCYI